jgi:hypothetical protein
VRGPVGLALLVTFDESEADRQHQLGVTVLGPELEQIGQDIDVPFTPIFGQYHAEGWRGMYAITGAIELALDKPGAHSVQVMLDGETAGDIPFLVLALT